MNITSLSKQYNLQDEVNRVSLYIYPIIVISTLTTNILNICVLCRRNLRSSSCTHYFLAFSLVSILYTCEVPVMMFLRIRFGFVAMLSPVGCPLQTFVSFVLPLFVSMMLVLASMDRFFISSSVERAGNPNHVRVTRRVIIATVILSIIYTVPSLFIYHYDDKIKQCVSYSSTIAIVYLSSRIVLFYIVIPLAMAIFGLLTIHNIRTQVRRVVPIIMNLQQQNRRRPSEGQLGRMLILQVGAYLVFSIPAGVGYTLVTFVPSMNTTFMNQLRIMFSLWQQSIYFLSFFLNILSSKTYRQELNHMLKMNFFCDQVLHHTVEFLRRNIATINENDNHV